MASEGEERKKEQGEKDWGTFPERCTMYAMLTGYVMSFKIPRFMINTIVPFIVADLGLAHTVTPTLLAAFHPGCARLTPTTAIDLIALSLRGCAAASHSACMAAYRYCAQIFRHRSQVVLSSRTRARSLLQLASLLVVLSCCR